MAKKIVVPSCIKCQWYTYRHDSDWCALGKMSLPKLDSDGDPVRWYVKIPSDCPLPDDHRHYEIHVAIAFALAFVIMGLLF